MKYPDFIQIAKAIKMLPNTRFYAILIVVGTVATIYVLPPLIAVLK